MCTDSSRSSRGLLPLTGPPPPRGPLMGPPLLTGLLPSRAPQGPLQVLEAAQPPFLLRRSNPTTISDTFKLYVELNGLFLNESKISFVTNIPDMCLTCDPGYRL